MKALFLDRDGVLNVLRPGDYVKTPDELVMLPDVREALALCRPHFDYIFVVTNQQGIGKGLMSEDDLAAIHRKMMESLGGLVDKIYHCPNLEKDHSFRRKPNVGMAIEARREHRGLQLKESTMVGDALSDMLFGRRAGMETVLVGDNRQIALTHPWLVDRCYSSLMDYACSLTRGSRRP